MASSEMDDRLEEGRAAAHAALQDDDENSDVTAGSDRSLVSTSTHNLPLSWDRPTAIAFMVILLGLAATLAFLGLGISSARSAADEEFEQSSNTLVQQVEIAWKDYEVAALWTHQACTSHEDFDHEDFRKLYEQLQSTGIDAQIEFLPNVTHEERPKYEARTREYYKKEYPYIDYKGFVGIEPVVVDNVTTGEMDLLPRSDADWYFPIHFIEPIAGSEAALDMDAYSRASARASLDKALKTWKPSLSEPTRLVEEIVPHALAVFLLYPGTPVPSQPDIRPEDLSLLVIRIPDLIRRALQTRLRSTSVYLYDTTGVSSGSSDVDNPDNADDGGTELFLGGMVLTVLGSDDPSDDDSSKPQVLSGNDKTHTLLPPTPLANVRRGRLIRERVVSIADREWTIAVVATDGSYDPETKFVVVGAILLFVCSLCTAAWVYSNIQWSNVKKSSRLREIQSAAEAEKAALILDNANRAAEVERTLNDFIAHEVRNPVAAAISACSFVRTAVREPDPLADEESRQLVRDDVDVIDNALNFINDLLRNMLDMQRATAKQLKIETKLTDIYNDVLKPVDSMLYSRGNSDVDVVVDCQPQHIVVKTDRLRLKQIMLNFCRNSQKFVERGFIRLSARVVDGLVQLSVEDSGPGIPAEKRRRLFCKFQESLDTLEQGTGIGLHLCDKLIRLMEGRVWLDETYDSGVENYPGTRFVIDLNISPTSLDDVDAALLASGSAQEVMPLLVDGADGDDDRQDGMETITELPTNLKILFTDDDMVVRKLFCRSVGKVAPSWEIHEASNGETAVRLATEEGNDFDLIFVDMYMASFEKSLLGTETVRELRARGVVDSIICGFSANDMATQFVEAGANTFLMKPFPCRKDQLETELKRILSTGDRTVFAARGGEREDSD